MKKKKIIKSIPIHIVIFIEKKKRINYIYKMNVEMDSVTGVPALSNYFNSLPLNPIFIVIIIIVILAYVLLFSSLGSAGSDTSPTESNGNGRALGIILAAVFLV